MKTYICSIDQRSFPTKEELVEHLLTTYSVTQPSGGETANIVQQVNYPPLIDLAV